jgi:hypothetical protein
MYTNTYMEVTSLNFTMENAVNGLEVELLEIVEL